jgi:hypothetical protein
MRQKPPQSGGNGLCQHCASTVGGGCYEGREYPGHR